MSRWAKPAPERTVGGGPEPEVKEIAFSEIKVTRHYIQPLPTLKSPTIGRAERPGAGGCRQTSAAPRLARAAL